ncbi:SDR family NAD(P)-dependent oxidoreductase [Paraburkholderia dilworthii]|uniref:SDR family NAD(P)-dependent oxidoreductase n=1 Tax=Paraburkholderia dilworthii TaxID=948106 RepID=UPI001FCC823A|nr:SDR family oxidoreductase [Paraburkholderia dilworthii]
MLLLDYKLEDWQRLMNINVTGTFLCAQRAARSMANAQYGRIVNLASISAERAGIGRVAYGTSKAAVVGLTRQLAMELGPLGITANAIAPGPVVTAMTAESFTDETIAAYSAMIPSRRLGTVEEMADAILFLASKRAGYINGVVLPVDGGYLASGVAKTGNLTN